MKKIDKIIITGQFLRGNYTTIRWIYSLFSDLLSYITGLPVYCLCNKNTPYVNNLQFIYVDIEKIYKTYKIPFEYTYFNEPAWSKSWSAIYNINEYNRDLYNYMNKIFKNSLVIGFELENHTKNVLNYLKINFIDMSIDPIRFLDDLMICFTSNNKNIYKKLLKHRVDEDFLYLSANYLKTCYQQHCFSDIADEKDKKLLFLGQTACDKTLIQNDKLYSILDHKKEFENSIKNYDKVLYKRHPFASNDEKILEYVKSLGNVEIIDENFYKLMSRNDIKKVVSISSGSCTEAKYFGKNVEFLLSEGLERQLDNKFNLNKYISVYQNYFSMNFWSDILSPVLKTKKYKKEISIAGAKNKLRNSRPGLYWSYNDFEQMYIKNDINKIFDEEQKILNNKIQEVRKKVCSSFFAFDNFFNDRENE